MRVNNPPMPSTEGTKNDTGLNKEKNQESDSLSFEIESDSSFELIEVEEEQMFKNPQPAAKEECIKNNRDDEIDFFSFSEDMGNKLAEGQIFNSLKPSTKEGQVLNNSESYTKGKYESKEKGRQPLNDHDPKPQKNATFVKNQSDDIDEIELDKETLVTLENSDETKEFSFQLEPLTKQYQLLLQEKGEQQLQISKLQEEVDGLKYQLERKHLELDAQWTTYQYLCRTIDAEEEKENSQQVQIDALLQKIDGLEKANAGLKGQFRTQKKTIEEKESLNKELKIELKDLRWSMKRQSDYFYQMEDSKEENEKEKELMNKELKLELNDLKLSMKRQMDYFYQMEKDMKSDIRQLKENHQGEEKVMKDVEGIKIGLEQMYIKDSLDSIVIEDMKKDIDQLKENEKKQQKVRLERGELKKNVQMMVKDTLESYLIDNDFSQTEEKKQKEETDDDEEEEEIEVEKEEIKKEYEKDEDREDDDDDDKFSALFAEVSKKSKEKKKAQEEEELISALFLETSEEEEEEEALEEEKIISALFIDDSEKKPTEEKIIKAKEIIKAKQSTKLKKRIEEKEEERKIASESSAVREGELDQFFPRKDNDNCKKNRTKFGEHSQRSLNRRQCRDLKRTTRRHRRKSFTPRESK
eukprot:Awhi_evm1s3664